MSKLLYLFSLKARNQAPMTETSKGDYIRRYQLLFGPLCHGHWRVTCTQKLSVVVLTDSINLPDEYATHDLNITNGELH